MHEIYAKLRNINIFHYTSVGFELSISGYGVSYFGEYCLGDGYHNGNGQGDGASDWNVHCLKYGDGGDIDSYWSGNGYEGDFTGDGGSFFLYDFCAQGCLVEL